MIFTLSNNSQQYNSSYIVVSYVHGGKKETQACNRADAYIIFILYLTHLYLLEMEERNTSTKSKMVTFRSYLISVTTL